MIWSAKVYRESRFNWARIAGWMLVAAGLASSLLTGSKAGPLLSVVSVAFLILLPVAGAALVWPHLQRHGLRWNATVFYRDGVLNIDYASRHRTDLSIPVSNVSCAYANGDELIVRLDEGRTIHASTSGAKELAEMLERDRTGVARTPAGDLWGRVIAGRWLRWVWAYAGFLPMLFAMEEAGRDGGATVVLTTFFLTWLWMSLGILGSAPQSVTVGTDGVRVNGPVGVRFIPFQEIESVQLKGRVLSLRLTSGKHVRIGTKNSAEIAGRIGSSLAAYRVYAAAHLSNNQQSMLARGNRDAEAWRERLIKLVAAPGYRREVVRVEDLEGIVADARTDPERRVAAALALPNTANARARILHAAAEAADPDLCIALEAAAEDEVATEALERALKRFAPEP